MKKKNLLKDERYYFGQSDFKMNFLICLRQLALKMLPKHA